MAAVSGSEKASMISAPGTAKPAAVHSTPPESHTSSPRSRRGARPVSSPWTQIVRGESEVIAAAPSSPSAAATAVTKSAPVAAMSSASSTSSGAEEESLENGGGGPTGNAGKKPAWNRPSNGSSSPELIDVMGAESWPALSEAARAPSKPTSDSLKGLSEGSSSILPAPQAIQTASSNSLNLKEGIDNANLNSTPSQPTSSRPRPVKRNGPNVFANGSTSQLTGVQIPAGEAYTNNSSPRDHNQRSSQSRGSTDHTQQPRNSYRNRGGGRGESSQHHSYGGRRDHDRANQDLNGRNFNGREAHLQPQRGQPRYIRHPPPPPPLPTPTSVPYMVPTSVGPPGPLLSYPDYHMYQYYRLPPPPLDPLRVPYFMASVQPAFVSPADHLLHSEIVKQIDYYFSNENLVKDIFLRQKMDDQGWVPIKLIAGFNKVSHLTDNVQLILEVLRSSIVVEVQGDKVRRRNDWARWIMPPAIRFPNAAAPGSSSHNVLVDSVQSMGLEHTLGHSSASGEAESHSGVFLHQSSSGDLTTQSQPPIHEETSSLSGSASDYNHSTSGRSSS